jgi:hypothetical protein
MNYEYIKTLLDESDSLEAKVKELTAKDELAFIKALEALAGMHRLPRGTMADLERATGRTSKTLTIYSAIGLVWVNDLDPYITARELQTIINGYVCHGGGVGMQLLKETANGIPTVEEFVKILGAEVHAKAKAKAEESQDSEEESQEEAEDSKESLLAVVLRALPNLTAEELATVADSVAQLATARTLTLA